MEVCSLKQVGVIIIVLRGCMFERRDAAGERLQVPRELLVGYLTLIVSRLSIFAIASVKGL